MTDEVMAGVGRWGINTALDNWNVIADIIVMAEGLSIQVVQTESVVITR